MSSCSSVPMISWMCLVYYDQARYVLRWHRISYTMYIASVRIEIHGQDIRYKYRALYATPSTLSNKISSYPTHPSSRVCVTLGLSDPAVFENGLQCPSDTHTVLVDPYLQQAEPLFRGNGKILSNYRLL